MQTLRCLDKREFTYCSERKEINVNSLIMLAEKLPEFVGNVGILKAFKISGDECTLTILTEPEFILFTFAY